MSIYSQIRGYCVDIWDAVKPGGSLLAAISAVINGLFVADAPAALSHVGAIGAGATWDSGWVAWGNRDRLEIDGSNDAAGTLYVEQNRTGAGAAVDSESWRAAAGSAYRFPTARGVGMLYVRVRFTDAGAGGAALAVTGKVTVGPIDHDAPVAPDLVLACGGGAFTYSAANPRPVGARFWQVWESQTASSAYQYNGSVRVQLTFTNGGAAPWGYGIEPTSGAKQPWPALLPSGDPPVYICVYETAGAGTVRVVWYP